MIELDYQTKLNQRVRLRSDGQDAVYAYAAAGSEGWVRGHKKDDMGYPLIKIEWDHDHWTYNGEPDKWAFEAHFEPVEDSMGMRDEEGDNPSPELVKLFAKMMEEYSKSQEPEKKSEAKDEYSVSPEKYAKLVKKAGEIAEKADGFLLMYVDREEADDGSPIYLPSVINAYKSAEGGILLEAHLAKLAAMSHEYLALRAIDDRLKEQEEKDGR